MKNYKHFARHYLPVAISLGLIVVLVAYAPWDQIDQILSNLHASTILGLLGLSLVYYGLKVVRFWYLLQAMNIRQPFKLVMLSYISAQPMSLLPAGEIYRSRELRHYTGVPIKTSLPQFLMQGLMEGSAMAIIMVVSTLALQQLRLPAIVFAVIILMLAIAISRGYITNTTRLANRIVPFINLTEKNIQRFNQRHKDVLSWNWLPLLLGLSIITELSGAAIAYTAVIGLGGHINFYQATLVYIIPVIVGFLSFLPGGFGISEQSAVGILLLSNLTVAHAVASTLIMRVTIVGLGLLYGCSALLIGHTGFRHKTLRQIRIADTPES